MSRMRSRIRLLGVGRRYVFSACVHRLFGVFSRLLTLWLMVLAFWLRLLSLVFLAGGVHRWLA